MVENRSILLQDARLLISGSSIAFIGSIIGNFLLLLINIILGRSLGASEYGLYVLAMSLTNLSIQLALLGIPNALLRLASSYKGCGDIASLQKIENISFYILLISSFIISVILFFLSAFISSVIFKQHELSQIINILAFSIPLSCITLWAASIARSMVKIWGYVFLHDIGGNLIKLISFILVTYIFNATVLKLAYAYLVSSFCIATISFIYIKKLAAKIRGLRQLSDHLRLKNFTAPTVSNLLKISVPMLFSGFIILVSFNVDKFMIGYFHPSSSVGIYNIAFVLTQQLGLFLSAVIVIFGPLIASAFTNGDMNRVKYLYLTGTRWAILPAIPFYLILIIYRNEALNIFGNDFANASWLIVIVSTGQLFNIATGPVGNLLYMSGRQNLELINSISVLILNFILNLLLIPSYGVSGAAIAKVISILLIHGLRTYMIFRLYNFQPFSIKSLYILIFLVFAVAADILFINALSIWSRILFTTLCMAVYFLISAFKLTEREDKEILSLVIRKLGHT